MKKLGKKKWIIIVAVIVVVAIIVGVANSASGKKTENVVTGTVAMIEKRTIANSINGNGTVESAEKEDVTGGSMGMEVVSVNVEAGDTVSAGDIICVFDTDNLQDRVEDLQEQVADVEENRIERNEEQDRLQIEAVNTQYANLKQLMSDLEVAKDDYKVASEELSDRKKAYQMAKEEAESSGVPLSEADKAGHESYISQQQTVVNTIQSRVDNIQNQIDRWSQQDNYVYVENKEENDEQAKERTDALNEQIADYQEQINEATVRASVSGVVTRINVKEGATFTGGVIASIEAVDQFVVEAQIEEYDIADIATGMKVLIKTDATRDAELEGEVTYIAPRATNSGSSAGGFNSLISGVDTSSFSSGSGSATYLVKIAISESNERLRLGMNAKVSILTEERVDAWSVPYDAVYTREDGSTYLEKVTGKDEDGNILTEEMNVELGIQGTYYVEVISSEIQEGIQILIPDAQGNSSIQELLNMMGADAGI
ncbi:MAG: HlyD family efflux transporter periplasmic adaptor subunit [Agathobacter sp.]|nr:HlyD family efflux transporter periplasmic adaptor subunit [Agathobacter sp.]